MKCSYLGVGFRTKRGCCIRVGRPAVAQDAAAEVGDVRDPGEPSDAAATADAAEAAPDVIVKSTVDEVLAVIKQTKDKRALRELAEQKVLPHFDFKRMTQLAVGRAWRATRPCNRAAPRRA